MIMLLALLAAGACWFFSCRPQNKPDTAGRETLTLGFSMPFLTLDPHQTEYGAQGLVFPLIYSFLVVPRADGTFAPDLATSWWSDNREKTWTFILRPDARFHDLRPVMAQDAAYSISRLRQINQVLDQAIESLECPEPHKLVIRLRHGIPYFLFQLAVEPIIPRLPPGTKDQNTAPIGSGPFQVVYREGSERILLAAFKDYFGGPPPLAAVEMKYIPDKEKLWIEFMNGRVQLCLAAAPENTHFMRLEPDYYRLEGGLSRAATVMLFNNRDDILYDRRIRKAIGHMLNIHDHIDSDLRGMAAPCPGPLGALSPYLPPESGPVGYDPQKANALLAEAGWIDHDGDGYRDKDGRDLEFKILVPLTFQTERETAVYIQKSLNQFGVKAVLVDKRFDRMVEEDLLPGSFQACLTEHGVNPRLLFHLPILWSSTEKGWGNVGRYSNPEVDQALEQLTSEDRTTEYADLLRKIQRLILDDQPAVWLYQKYEVHAFSRRLMDLAQPDPDFFVTFPLRKARLIPRQDLAH